MSMDRGSNAGHTVVRAPTHPVSQLQKPFEESMLESATESQEQDVPLDAMTRRTMLLDAPTYNRVIAGRWKQKTGEKFHPLWKLIAQMSFGMHLLAQNLAISEEEVMIILQSHVDDIDGFLERTTEDFELAQSDIHERLRCLKLPLAHGEVFDRMLEDRAFRASILDGNEKIEHVINRTKRAAKDALKDVQKGFDATNTLEKYLTKLHSSWRRDCPEHEAVLVAMLGNVEGWRRAFLELHLEGNKLAGLLKKLAEVVAEMQRRAAAVSRNLVAKSQQPRTTTSRPNHMSQSGSIVTAKPLPTEPGQRRGGTRNSSQSTTLTGFSSRSGSGNKSSQGMTSSAQSPESRRTESRETSRRSISDAARAMNQNRSQQATVQGLGLGGMLEQSDNEHPIELPADVPQDLLRQAPVSVKNRLSMTLGLDAKSKADHRISSVYYPRALGDLLKSPGKSQLLLSPNLTANVATPVSAVITSPIYGLESGPDYFAVQQGGDLVEALGQEEATKMNSGYVVPTAIRGSVRASIVEPTVRTRRTSNPAFTSHPAVMAMATPPVELPAAEQRDEQSLNLALKQTSSPSSIGEPGPAMAEGDSTRSTSVSDAKLVVDTSIVTVSIIPASAEEETFQAAALKDLHAPVEDKVKPNEDVVQSGESIQQVHTDVEGFHAAKEEVQAAPGTSDEILTAEPVVEKSPGPGTGIATPVEVTTMPSSATQTETKSDKSLDVVAAPTVVVPETQTFVAELEANVPHIPTVEQASGPVELEAPVHSFKLPPRSIAVSSNPDKEVPRASILNVDDFFKLPTELSIKPGMKAEDSGQTIETESNKPLKLKLTKLDGKIVPVPTSPGIGAAKEEKRTAQLKLKTDVVADIINTISQTPPGSPIHKRSSSTVSKNSAQRWSHRSSQSLGAGAAPPPPGPGGRTMVNPDFASAGEFEGERKQKKKKKISIVSKEKWKLFFQNGSLNAQSRSGAGVTSVAGDKAEKTTRESGTGLVSPGTDMMTGSGKDILWFKGEAKKAADVASPG